MKTDRYLLDYYRKYLRFVYLANRFAYSDFRRQVIEVDRWRTLTQNVECDSSTVHAE